MKYLLAIVKQGEQTLVFYYYMGTLCMKVVNLPITEMIDGLCEYYHTSLKTASQYIKEKHNFSQKVPIYLGDQVYFPTQGQKDPGAWINYNFVSDTKKINDYETCIYFKSFRPTKASKEDKIMLGCNIRVIKNQLVRCDIIYKKGVQAQEKYKDCFKN